MGLDVVELVMEVEETFGIKVKDEEYEQIKTVGEFHDLIIRKGGQVSGTPLGGSRCEPTQCLSLVGFVQLRRAFMRLFDVPRNLIRPTTALDNNSEQLCIPADQITPDKRFVEDLGC